MYIWKSATHTHHTTPHICMLFMLGPGFSCRKVRKFQLDPNAKAFTFNTAAKEFVPSSFTPASSISQSSSVSKLEYKKLLTHSHSLSLSSLLQCWNPHLTNSPHSLRTTPLRNTPSASTTVTPRAPTHPTAATLSTALRTPWDTCPPLEPQEVTSTPPEAAHSNNRCRVSKVSRRGGGRGNVDVVSLQ